MAWARADSTLPSHFKTGKAARALSASANLPLQVAKAVVIGSLNRIWMWAMQLQIGEDGFIGCDEADLLDAVGFGDLPAVGEPVIVACMDSGFLHQVDDGYVIHDWRDWQEKAATSHDKKKELARDRQRTYRERKRKERDKLDAVTRDVGVTGDASNAPTVRNETVRNVTDTTGEEETLVGQSDATSLALTMTSESQVHEKPNGNGKHSLTHVQIREHLSGVLAEVQQGRKDRIKVDEMRAIMAELVFAYWQAELGHEKAKLDPARLTRLKKFLKGNGDNVHELLYAVDGWARDPTFKQLAERDGRKLDGIENIFESQSRIERLAGHCKGYRDGTPHRMAVKYLEAVQS